MVIAVMDVRDPFFPEPLNVRNVRGPTRVPHNTTVLTNIRGIVSLPDIGSYGLHLEYSAFHLCRIIRPFP